MNDIGMICDALQKLGLAGKEAFFVYMGVKSFEILATAITLIYALKIITSAILRGIQATSFLQEIKRVLPPRCKDYEDNIDEGGKKKIIGLLLDNKEKLNDSN